MLTSSSSSSDQMVGGEHALQTPSLSAHHITLHPMPVSSLYKHPSQMSKHMTYTGTHPGIGIPVCWLWTCSVTWLIVLESTPLGFRERKSSQEKNCALYATSLLSISQSHSVITEKKKSCFVIEVILPGFSENARICRWTQ